MSTHEPDEIHGTDAPTRAEPVVSVAEAAPKLPPPKPAAAIPHRPLLLLPVLLFTATCLSTWLVGGLAYAGPVMFILVCHEAGHFIQARRYGVYTSYPLFIPMPVGPLGTLGAVIAMDPRIGNRRKLFDIGITGPLAGLVPTLIFCALGLHWSEPVPGTGNTGGTPIGVAPVLQLLVHWFADPVPEGYILQIHPMAFAGWVGLLLTSLNLMPIGQLDGGHVLYALLPKQAHRIASTLLLAAIASVIVFESWSWVLMLTLAILIGPFHPPTGDDDVPLGPVRTVLGWLTLAFIPLGFVPDPFMLAR